MMFVAWLLLACSKPAQTDDIDGDGVPADEDCNDNNPSIGASAAEICNGLDEDCDGLADNDLPLGFFRDADHDGAGDPTTEACAGDVQRGDDCDDANADRTPGAVEVCDGLDNDCDTDIDEELPHLFLDRDGDGFGDEVAPDCQTGGIATETGGDCDDDDFTVNPGAAERCNGADDDCDGVLDEGLAANTFYEDRDGDGHGDLASPVIACAAPERTSKLSDDCDDTNEFTSPSADEFCDEVDNDCDGSTDDDPVDGDAWYADVDHDGWGDPAVAGVSCAAPLATTTRKGDCDDDDDTINPDESETCDGVDEDCDGSIDEIAIDRVTVYSDADGDSYGDAATKAKVCPYDADDYVSNDDDCDDADEDVHPGAVEVCDGVDEDCDGTADDAAIDATIWYLDADSDGFGDASATSESCDLPTGYAAEGTDCNDADDAINPDTACDWRARIPSPGAAEIYLFSATAQDIDVDGTLVSVSAGGIASTTASGEITCAADSPFVAWVIGASRGGDQLVSLRGDDGPLDDELYGWSGGYIQLFNPTGGKASVTLYSWTGSAWSSSTTGTVAAGSTSTLYASWGMYKVESDLPLTGLGLEVDNVENHMEYIPTTDGKMAGKSWQFSIPAELGEVGFNGLCVDSAGCRVTIDAGTSGSATTLLDYTDTITQMISAGTLYTVTSTGLMVLRDEATPGGYTTSDGSTMDADYVPGLTGSTLDTDFILSTTLGMSTSYIDRLTDLTFLPYEDATTITVASWDGSAFVDEFDTLLDADESYAWANLDSNEVWSVTSDAPIQILMSHASSEFAFAAPSLYYAD